MADQPLAPILISPLDEPLTCLQVNDAWIPFLIGVVRQYQYHEQWTGTLEENRQARQYARVLLDILAESLGCDDVTNCCCNGQDLIIQVISQVTVNGEWNVSVDGGETWHPAPDDPRGTIPDPAPPVDSGMVANKCDAATNIVQHLHDVQAGISHDLTLVVSILEFLKDCIETVLAEILFETGLIALEPLVPILGGIFTGIYGHAAEDYDALFTSDVWDAVLCLLLCNMSDSGRFSQSAFEQVISDCKSKIPGGWSNFSAASSIQAMIKTWGLNGLNQAATFGNAVDADCTGCNCSCDDLWELSYPLDPIFGTLTKNEDGTITIATEAVNTNGHYYIDIRTPSESLCCYSVGYTPLTGGNPSIFMQKCGTAFSINNWDGGPAALCVHHIQLISNAPFSGIYEFSECP